MKLSQKLEQLIQRMGVEHVQPSSPMDEHAELHLKDQMHSLQPDINLPDSLMELLRIHDGQTGMPMFSYFRLCSSKMIAERFEWFRDQHPHHVPFAEGAAEDYLMIDCTASETPGDNHGAVCRWYIENSQLVPIAHSIEDLIQRSIDGVEHLGKPNINILDPIYAFDFPSLDESIPE